MNRLVSDARRRLDGYRALLEALLADRAQTDLESVAQALSETQEALERIERGVYGNCLRCGGAIGGLLASPAARYCAGCASGVSNAATRL